MSRRRRAVSTRRPWGFWPAPQQKPAPQQEVIDKEAERRAALEDEALTLHSASLFMMAPRSEE